MTPRVRAGLEYAADVVLLFFASVGMWTLLPDAVPVWVAAHPGALQAVFAAGGALAVGRVAWTRVRALNGRSPYRMHHTEPAALPAHTDEEDT